MDACADGAHSWTLRRISGGSEGSGISDFLGVCIGTADIGLSAAPTSSSFKEFVAGFRRTAKVGSDLRYKGRSLLQKGQRGLPTLDEDGSVLNITLDHEAGTVTLRAPELENPCLGTIRIEEEDRGLPSHLHSYLGRGNAWEVIESRRCVLEPPSQAQLSSLIDVSQRCDRACQSAALCNLL